jgi:predicted MFS family arabinose efflux permease
LAIGAGFAMPALQSLIAAQAAPQERGAVMGLSQSASACGRAVGAVAVGPLYDGLGAGAPFFVGAVLLAIVLASTVRAPVLVRN